MYFSGSAFVGLASSPLTGILSPSDLSVNGCRPLIIPFRSMTTFPCFNSSGKDTLDSIKTAVLSIGTAASIMELLGTSYTASDTEVGSSTLGESDSLTAPIPISLGTLSAYAAVENITVCITSIIARNKDNNGLPTLRLCFNTRISSISKIFVETGIPDHYKLEV
ncbi:hypothetical protein D3C74_381210 [compost metagenome]